MKILITGATGFLGQVLSEMLLEQGHTLTLMGRDFSGIRNLLYMGAVPLRLDLREGDKVRAACRGMDAVCHVGALSSAWGPRQEFWDINVEGTRSVLEGCLEHHVRRLVHVSSPSVVFDGKDHLDLTEDAPYAQKFLSMYAETKKQAEKLILGARALLEVAVVRPKAIYGPGDRSLLPNLLEAARQGRLPQIGNGQNRIDLTFVDDAARSLVLALEHSGPRPAHPLWHITGGEHVRLWDLIDHLLEHQKISRSRRKISLETAVLAATLMEQFAHLSGKVPSLSRYTAFLLARTQTYNISKAKLELGYVPQVSLEEGLRRTLERLER